MGCVYAGCTTVLSFFILRGHVLFYFVIQYFGVVIVINENNATFIYVCPYN